MEHYLFIRTNLVGFLMCVCVCTTSTTIKAVIDPSSSKSVKPRIISIKKSDVWLEENTLAFQQREEGDKTN